MPEEWRQIILVPIFKNKGDVQSCTYRGINPYNEAMGERAPLQKNDKCDQKSVWFHAWEDDHGSHLLVTTTYGEIQGAKGHAYGAQ